MSLLGLLGIGVIAIAGYIVYVLNSFPTHSFNHFLTDDTLLSKTISRVEGGASTNYSDFKNYLLYTKLNNSLSGYIEQLKDEEKIKVEKGVVYFLSDFDLPPLYKNECRHLYCMQHSVPFYDIPSVFWKGLIGIEDERFLEHSGVDYISIIRALYIDVVHMGFVQGGSTLTQQLVKNLFLTGEKKISRKLKEMIFSVYIESHFTKEEILEGYLNEAYWGVAQGVVVKGLHAASAVYFEKSPNEITPFEASILISMLKGPGFYSPLKHLDRLKERVEVVFNKLKNMHHIADSEQMWTEKEWDRWHKKLMARNEQRYEYSLWDAMEDESLYFDDYDHYQFRRGIERIKPFIKMRTKDYAKNISVKAVFGSVDQMDLFEYYSSVERNHVKAIYSEKHLVGSILKPIAYSVFLDLGKKYDDQISLEPITLKLKSGRWTPREAHRPDEESISLIRALSKSYNNPVIRTADELGFEAVEPLMMNYIPTLKKPLKEFPAQLLGGIEMSVMDVFNVYKNFITVEKDKVRDNVEENLLIKMSDPELTTVSVVATDRMKNLRFFGKTGTSNAGLDNWFVSFDGKNIGVIWVGFEGDRTDVKLNLYGAGTSFRIFQDFTLNRGKRFNELLNF